MARRKIERNIAYDEERRKFYVYQDYGRSEEGDRIRRYRTYYTLAQARRALACFQADRVRKKLVLPQSMTVGEWLEEWMTNVVAPTRAASTEYGYRNIVENHLVPALGEVALERLTPRHVQKYYTDLLAQGLSPNTVRRHHDLLSTALRMAQRQGLLCTEVMAAVTPPRQVKKEPKFYTPEEVRALYAAAESSWLEPVIKLAGFLGLRREEICGLKWSSVDFARHNIIIKEARTSVGSHVVEKETKNTSSVRVLYLPEELQQYLRAEQARQQARGGDESGTQDGYVVVDRLGKPCSPNVISRGFQRLIRRSGLPEITLHGLRHTFATVASAQGVPLFEISKALGHSTPTTTGRIYTHLMDSAQTSAISSVAAAIQG